MTEPLEERIGTADTYGTSVEVVYSPTDEHGDGMIFLSLTVGGFHARSAPTPGAARQIAAALIDACVRYGEDRE